MSVIYLCVGLKVVKFKSKYWKLCLWHLWCSFAHLLSHDENHCLPSSSHFCLPINLKHVTHFSQESPISVEQHWVEQQIQNWQSKWTFTHRKILRIITSWQGEVGFNRRSYRLPPLKLLKKTGKKSNIECKHNKKEYICKLMYWLQPYTHTKHTHSSARRWSVFSLWETAIIKLSFLWQLR